MNNVLPGFIDSQPAFRERIPMRRYGRTEEIAAVIAFLSAGLHHRAEPARGRRHHAGAHRAQAGRRLHPSAPLQHQEVTADARSLTRSRNCSRNSRSRRTSMWRNCRSAQGRGGAASRRSGRWPPVPGSAPPRSCRAR